MDTHFALIRNYFSKFSNEKISRINDLTSGYDNKVYHIISNNNDFILRVPRTPLHQRRHIYALSKLKEFKNIPNLLFIHDKYTIETKIKGIPLSQKSFNHSILYEVGALLKKIHYPKFEGFGDISKNGIGKNKSWNSYLLKHSQENFLEIKKAKLLPDSQLQEISRLLSTIKKIRVNVSSLLHMDITKNNIMVNKGMFSGLIDFSDCILGDPLYDIAVTLDNFYPKNILPFLVGYGTKMNNKIKLYGTIQNLWSLRYFGIIEVDKSKFNLSKNRINYFLSM